MSVMLAAPASRKLSASFSPSKSPKRGRRTEPNLADRLSIEKQGPSLGDRCLVGDKQMGHVRFVGLTKFAEGIWVGIELDRPNGKNDGSVQGVEYFRCAASHGIFVRPHMVTVVNVPDALPRASFAENPQTPAFGVEAANEAPRASRGHTQLSARISATPSRRPTAQVGRTWREPMRGNTAIGFAVAAAAGGVLAETPLQQQQAHAGFPPAPCSGSTSAGNAAQSRRDSLAELDTTVIRGEASLTFPVSPWRSSPAIPRRSFDASLQPPSPRASSLVNSQSSLNLRSLHRELAEAVEERDIAAVKRLLPLAEQHGVVESERESAHRLLADSKYHYVMQETLDMRFAVADLEQRMNATADRIENMVRRAVDERLGLQGRFELHQGRIPEVGNELLVRTMTVSQAKEHCRKLIGCAGFWFDGEDVGQPLPIHFVSRFLVVGTKGCSYKFEPPWIDSQIRAEVHSFLLRYLRPGSFLPPGAAEAAATKIQSVARGSSVRRHQARERERQRWEFAFRDVVSDTDGSVHEDGFVLALSRAAPRFSAEQATAIWRGFAAQAGEVPVGCTAFVELLASINADEKKAASVADMSVDAFRGLARRSCGLQRSAQGADSLVLAATPEFGKAPPGQRQHLQPCSWAAQPLGAAAGPCSADISALFRAVESNDEAALRAALSGKANEVEAVLQVRDQEGKTLLHAALCHPGGEHAAKAILEATAIHAERLRLDFLVQGEFLERQLNRIVDGADMHGRTALMALCTRPLPKFSEPPSIAAQDLVAELLFHRADPEQRDKEGMTPFLLCAQSGNLQVMAVLLGMSLVTDANTDIDNRYRTALHHAAKNGQVEAVELLLAADADVEAMDLDGRTAVDLARSAGHEAVAVLLGAAANVVGDDGSPRSLGAHPHR